MDPNERTASPQTPYPRETWVAALRAAPAERLDRVASDLASRYPSEPVELPRAGLALLPLRESVRGEEFYLGEVPLSQAHLRLKLEDGRVVHGAAVVMADDEGLAQQLALCDAVLAHALPGNEAVAEVIALGHAVLRQREQARAAMRERTRVDFSLLNQEADS